MKKNDNQAINKAQSALKAGDRKKARRWALKVIREIPQNEEPWLIMAAISEPNESIKYLKKALQINPESKKARKGMHWAASQLKEKSARKKTSRSVNKTTSMKVDSDKKRKTKIQKKKKKSKSSVRKKKSSDSHWVVILFASIVIFGLASFAWFSYPLISAKTITAKESHGG